MICGGASRRVRTVEIGGGGYTGRVASVQVEPRILRFGAFELDVRNSQLRRGGVLVKLAPQQFRLLRCLAENPGHLSTREEIQQNIWGAEVFVDFDRSLNVCIAQLRSALNDDSEAPRFIQTVPRRGYRFVAPVERVDDAPPPPAPPRRVRPWIAIFAVALCAAAALFAWRAAQPPARAMLAVLPFENVTHRAEDAPVLAGLLDELLTQFGTAVPGRLGVIGRTSVMHYSGHNPGLPQIARELGVAYVIEGDARFDGGRLRISARLVDARDQRTVWAETYEQSQSGIFELQEDIAASVTAGVVRTLFPDAAVVRTRRPTADAYQAFLNGRYWQSKDARQALEWFEQAAQRDPAFAAAYSAIAETETGFALSGTANGHAEFEKARSAAQQALRLDDASAEAHNALARVLFWHDWNWTEAQRHYQRALAANPSFAQAWHDYAFLQVATGHAEAGVSSLRRAIALDPLSARVNVDAGWVLLQAHHFSEAQAHANRALELEPGLREAEACIARARFYSEPADDAALDFYRRRTADPRAYNRALAAAVLGRNEDEIVALEAAFDRHDVQMPLIASEPAFASLAKDPRFRAIKQKLQLTEP
jgi:TolB-like protein/DNA-binding winged helix-turn-helix (wHTH) protein/Tfp pilus assembly protein PilF